MTYFWTVMLPWMLGICLVAKLAAYLIKHDTDGPVPL